MKLRLWHWTRRLLGYAPLTLSYGDSGWITVDERDWLQLSIFSTGAYEPEVWEALARFATMGDVVWDVGACIGSFTLKAAQDRRVRTVCAFEPDPLTLTALRRNLALNGDPATVYPFALSDTTEPKELIHGPSLNSGMSTLTPTSGTGMSQHVLASSRVALPRFEIACRTADELIQEGEAPQPTLMKIDVEGWEYHVLNGAKQLLASSSMKAIVFEAASDPTARLADERLQQLLNRFDYEVRHVSRPGGELRGVENYLAVRR